MNTMSDFRFSWVHPTKIHRRSLLATFAAVAAVLTISRRSDAAERFDAGEDAQGSPRPSGEVTRRGDQVPTTVDLKTLGPKRQIASIVGSGGAYVVTTVSGKATSF